MSHLDSFYIGGKWVPSAKGGTIEVVNPSTEEVLGSIPEGDAAAVDRAVRAAADAFEAWAALSAKERQDYLRAIVDLLKSRQDEMGDVIAKEIGTPRKVAGWLQAGIGPIDLETYITALDDYPFEEDLAGSRLLREPVGVVGAITPWNYPLHQITNKAGAALAAGCTVVLKPSEVAPLSAYLFTEIVDAAGLPPGVFNMVTGYGPTVGEAIVTHPLVDMVSFTGSNAVGKRISVLAAERVKKVALELGGKSASVVLEDADLEKAVKGSLRSCYQNAGQTCNALTRMVVPRKLLPEVERFAVEQATTYTPGDPFDPASRLGPMANAKQWERVRNYIQVGVEEGAKVLTGGVDAEVPQRGYFVAPTVFTNVRPEMRIAQEEIFGPVLSIIPYDTEKEAVEIANGTVYGLNAAVWSEDQERADRVARQMQSGQVQVNGGNFNPLAPFGGYKQSGLGREGGRFGIDEFVELKSVQY